VPEEDGRPMLKATAQFSAVGIEIGICIGLGFYGGYRLDEWLETTPYLTFILGALGIGAAIKVLHRIIKRTDLDKL